LIPNCKKEAIPQGMKEQSNANMFKQQLALEIRRKISKS